MPQLDYLDQRDLPAFEGGLYDTGLVDVVSRNPGGNVAQIDTITLSGTPGNAETYILSLEGVNASFTTDASATLQEMYDGLLAVLVADPYWPGFVTITGNGTTIITLTAKVAGVPFTLLEVQDASANIVVATATANVTGNPVPFGRALVAGAAADSAVLPSGTFSVLQGISVNRAKARPIDHSQSPPITGAAIYGAAETVPTMRWGRLWVKVEETVVAGDAVRIRHTQGTNPLHTVGRFRTGAVANETVNATSGARYVTGAATEGLAVIEFNVHAMAFTADT